MTNFGNDNEAPNNKGTGNFFKKAQNLIRTIVRCPRRGHIRKFAEKYD